MKYTIDDRFKTISIHSGGTTEEVSKLIKKIAKSHPDYEVHYIYEAQYPIYIEPIQPYNPPFWTPISQLYETQTTNA